MSDLGRAATARRLYLHVLSGGSLTPDDVSRMVQAIEELGAKLATARNDALEEAAPLAEAFVRRAMHLSMYGYDIEREHGGIAKEASNAIRALKSTNQT